MFSRRGGYGGRSKATPTTTCQKCLQKGHYSYECTVSAQERPYKPRPSRTQQLLNPSLKPKLIDEVPSDLLRSKKGLADKILAEKEEQRRKTSGRRSRSESSVSDSDSISTISTNRSRSPSPKRIKDGSASLRGGDTLRKRGRRSVSSGSNHPLDRAERNTRRRLSSMSPEQRGRRRSRSRSSPMDISHDEGSRRKAPRKHHSPSRSYTKGRGGRRSRSRSRRTPVKPLSRRSLSRSPSRSPDRLDRMDTSDDRPHPQDGLSPIGRPVRISRSRSRSPYRRRSRSLHSKRSMSRSPSPYKSRNNGGVDGKSVRSGRHRFDTDVRHPEPVRAPPPQPAPPRERSLSPYSKRVALTRQMQGGH
ncbi:hypothetical protein PMIN06_011146 [Paraphaeosphaeria minitans]|uniref:Zinc knuckle-domain-containing protein n=1 Tax=Paraphaeosphaeria minitans TaxID=565426 RepID=A0A9P6KTW0_9PLEO|nr:hypothetical protein PMIN01_04010 [Paraphaeosphaeria minitans]